MTDRFLTVVIRNPTTEEVRELTYHPKLSTTSWSHAMDERDRYIYSLRAMTDLLTRLLALAELAVDEALQFEYGDPEDRHIWRELQELKPLVQQALTTTTETP